MRSMTPRPFLLIFTLLLVGGAIFAIETRFGVAGPVETRAEAPPQDATGRTTPERVRPAGSEELERKEAEVRLAEEIVAPTGYINTDGVSIEAARGEKVVLVDFWTYSC